MPARNRHPSFTSTALRMGLSFVILTVVVDRLIEYFEFSNFRNRQGLAMQLAAILMATYLMAERAVENVRSLRNPSRQNPHRFFVQVTQTPEGLVIQPVILPSAEVIEAEAAVREAVTEELRHRSSHVSAA